MWRRTRWRPTDKRAKVERGQREATLLGWAPGHRACLASGSPEHAQATHGSPRAAGGTSAGPSLWGGEASGTQGLGRGGCSCRPTATSDHEEPAEPSTGSPPRATQRPRSAVCTPSTRATGRNVSTAQARLALSAASRAATPAGPRRHQGCSDGGKAMGKGSSGPGRAPCAQRGDTHGTAPQVCTSIPRTPHTAVQATSGFCLPGRGGHHFLSGGPHTAGLCSRMGGPRVQGSGLPLRPTHPAGPCCLWSEGSLSAPRSYVSYD